MPAVSASSSFRPSVNAQAFNPSSSIEAVGFVSNESKQSQNSNNNQSASAPPAAKKRGASPRVVTLHAEDIAATAARSKPSLSHTSSSVSSSSAASTEINNQVAAKIVRVTRPNTGGQSESKRRDESNASSQRDTGGKTRTDHDRRTGERVVERAQRVGQGNGQQSAKGSQRPNETKNTGGKDHDTRGVQNETLTSETNLAGNMAGSSNGNSSRSNVNSSSLGGSSSSGTNVQRNQNGPRGNGNRVNGNDDRMNSRNTGQRSRSTNNSNNAPHNVSGADQAAPSTLTQSSEGNASSNTANPANNTDPNGSRSNRAPRRRNKPKSTAEASAAPSVPTTAEHKLSEANSDPAAPAVASSAATDSSSSKRGGHNEKKTRGGRNDRGNNNAGRRPNPRREGEETPAVPKQPESDLSRLPLTASRSIDDDARSIASNISALSLTSRSSKKGNKRPVLEHSTQAKEIIRRLTAQEYECVICSNAIGRRGKIWSCERCFLLMHQSCTQLWYDSKKQDGARDGEVNWPCPGCMFENKAPPPPYHCYCGKVQDPEYDPYLTPHSCGGLCQKKRGEDCPHLCTIQCHPGMCPPCSALGAKMMCPCGQTEYQLRCGEAKKDRPCQQVCSKPLSCGNPAHTCPLKCHVGPCVTCELTVPQTCYCMKNVNIPRLCGTGQKDAEGKAVFACGSMCEKLLSCGNHRCRRKCHSGPCFTCAREPTVPQRCACGRKTADRGQNWKRKSCTDPLPLCGQICERPLSCLIHNCKLKCHDSPCPECNTTVTRQCYCGRDEVKLSCAAYCDIKRAAEDQKVSERILIRCKKKCKVRLNCTQHTCGRECCTGEGYVHRCPRVCNKPLDCGSHNCDAFCHLGYCEPCRVVHRNGLSCACGKTRVEGVMRCGDPIPECPFPCSAPRSCEHPCKYRCHPGPCPPCAVLEKRPCAGGHTIVPNTPCHLKFPTCPAKCGKRLACGRHSCTRQCHAGPCIADEKVWSLSDSKSNESGVTKCGNLCGLSRPNCAHTCTAPCHPTETCPDLPCPVTVIATCDCGRQKKQAKCGATNLKPNRLNRLKCDTECEVYQRNLRFRDALQINEAPMIPYPAVFMDKVIHDGLVEVLPRIEAMFADLLKTNAKTKYLPPMQSKQRWLCHQMSAFYMLESESLDPGAQRAVRLLKTPRTIAPKMLLSEAISQYVASRGTARTIPQPLLLDLYDMNKPKRTPADVRTFLRELDQRYKLVFLDNSRAILVFADTHARQEAKSALTGKLNMDGPTEELTKLVSNERETKTASEPIVRRSGDAWGEDDDAPEEILLPEPSVGESSKYVAPSRRPNFEKEVPPTVKSEPARTWPKKEESKPKPPTNVFSLLMDDEAEGDQEEGQDNSEADEQDAEE